MRNNLFRSAVVAAILFSLVAGFASVSAQGASSGSAGGSSRAMTGTAVTGIATVLPVPAGYTVIPPDDADRSDDQIVQLENLTIQSMTSGKVAVPMTIYASRNIGGPCREYMSVNSSGSKMYPCPMAPTVLYQISVESDTILLLRNRARANIDDFAIGDRINVFGFLDPGTSGVQALIVRDLDKPAITASQYVQLNNLAVISAPDSSVAPATFLVARKGIETCFAFASVSAARGVSAPCPMGTDVNTSAGISAELPTVSSPDFYRPFQQYYSVHVSSQTKVMNVSRQSIGLGNIQTGDHVNIYGRYNPSNRTIEALIVRDLSVPREPITPEPTKKVSLSSVNPSEGYHGTTVTLRGKGFSATGNIVYFGSYNVANASSKDGITISFTVPEYVSPCKYDPYDPNKAGMACIEIALRLPADKYPVSVLNEKGVSNSLSFNLIDAGTIYPSADKAR